MKVTQSGVFLVIKVGRFYKIDGLELYQLLDYTYNSLKIIENKIFLQNY